MTINVSKEDLDMMIFVCRDYNRLLDFEFKEWAKMPMSSIKDRADMGFALKKYSELFDKGAKMLILLEGAKRGIDFSI